MKQYIFYCFFMLVALQVNSQSYSVIGGFLSPESVLQSGKQVYVSNVGSKLKPQAKDGDGFISLLSADGQIIQKQFLPAGKDTLNAPKGMVLLKNILYVADIDRVVGFNIKNKRKVFELSLHPASSYLNDLAMIDEQHLVVSATDLGKVYMITLSNKTFIPLPIPVIKGANGLSYDGVKHVLYVNGFGDNGKPTGGVYGVDFGDHFKTGKLLSREGYYDGMAIDHNVILFSDWVAFEKKGQLFWADTTTGAVTSLSLPELIGGPADLWLDASSNILWIPSMLEGKVYRVVLDHQGLASH